jgi:bifunctional DNase/RNase
MIGMRVVVPLALILTVGTAVAAPEKPSKTPAPKKVVREGAPEGFVEMFVAGVLTTEGGPAVILRDKSEKKLLPIWIGFAEAHAIQLRLERKRFPRPLTHDLLETIMQDLGGSLVKIHVDDLKGDTYVGTVFVRRGEEIRHFDARPSDSIALALGNQVPIYVSEGVLKRANDFKDTPSVLDPPEPSEPPEGLKTL